MYKYASIDTMKVGSIVERVKSSCPDLPIGTVCVVALIGGSAIKVKNYKGFYTKDFFKVIKTRPGAVASAGDTVICLEGVDSTATYGAIFKNIPRDSDLHNCYFKKSHSWRHTSFLVLEQRTATKVDFRKIHLQLH